MNDYDVFFDNVLATEGLQRYDLVYDMAERVVSQGPEASTDLVAFLEAASRLKKPERGVWRSVLVIFKPICKYNPQIAAAYDCVVKLLRQGSTYGIV